MFPNVEDKLNLEFSLGFNIASIHHNEMLKSTFSYKFEFTLSFDTKHRGVIFKIIVSSANIFFMAENNILNP